MKHNRLSPIEILFLAYWRDSGAQPIALSEIYGIHKASIYRYLERAEHYNLPRYGV